MSTVVTSTLNISSLYIVCHYKTANSSLLTPQITDSHSCAWIYFLLLRNIWRIYNWCKETCNFQKHHFWMLPINYWITIFNGIYTPDLQSTQDSQGTQINITLNYCYHIPYTLLIYTCSLLVSLNPDMLYMSAVVGHFNGFQNNDKCHTIYSTNQ